MVILETSVFTRRVTKLLDEEGYRQLQVALLADPRCGVLIPGGSGLRKLRWRSSNHGKRGGHRVIYYWATSSSQVLLLMIYAKNERSDLSPTQLRTLAAIVRQEFP